MATHNVLLKAACFAAEKHKYQRRKGDDSSYICHPLGVAQILQWSGRAASIDLLVAAILHDTVEDTDATLEEIEREFGAKVAGYVREVTDDKSLPKLERKKLQIEHARHASREAQLIKLADKIHNCSDLLKVPPKGWTQIDIQGYILWSREVIEAIPLDPPLHTTFYKILNTKVDGTFVVPSSLNEQKKILAEYYNNMK
uniref:HD domain protein n=1 Tax=Marseillevirus LCMAC101 TaxID=2506602 RepID=A0A481YTL2_9VIRU|nr:MAG: HD domain protein [Marseillevirus LCMAC101]